jgi:prepilin-type N-terminal cleavage/methylation domain-containing protein
MEIALVSGMRVSESVARCRAGFTLIELLIVVVIGGIAGAVAVPSVSRSLAQSRAQQTASIIAADMQLAHSMAARQRRPVTIAIDEGTLHLRVFDTATPSRVFSSRSLGQSGGHIALKTDPAQVTIFPSGLASGNLTVQLGSGSSRRKVEMTRAGQVRVSAK